MNSAARHEEKLSALPDMFRSLLDQPLRPLTRARLPQRGAVYLFYLEDEPIHVGSPPHLEEVRMLAPSVRLALKVAGRRPAGSDRMIMALQPSPEPGEARTRRTPLSARWLALPDADDRMLLEIYAAQTLGLSMSHPGVRQTSERQTSAHQAGA